MASEVCKAYIRGALVTNWFWNKLLGHPHRWNQRWCLELRVNNHALSITKVFSIIPAGLRDPDSFRQSKGSSEHRTETMHASFSQLPPKSRVTLAWAGDHSPSSWRGVAAPSSAHIPEGGLLWSQGWAQPDTAVPAQLSPNGGVAWVRSLGPSLLLSNQWNQTLPVAISILGCYFLSACP